MILDQLPDELIAHIGSYLSSENNRKFGLSQKRIQKILERYGLDKPECDLLVFEDTFYYHVLDDSVPFQQVLSFPPCESGQNVRYPLAVTDEKYSSVQGEIMGKFRSIGKIHFDNANAIDENILKDLLKSKVKTQELEIEFTEVVFEDATLFVSTCKKFDSVLLYVATLPDKFYCDRVFMDILPNTRMFLHSLRDFYPLVDGYDLTDRTLNALTFPKVIKWFKMNKVFTSFTVEGIKTVVEEVLRSKTFDAELDLGILKLKEEQKADEWMKETNLNPDSPYVIYKIDPVLSPFPSNLIRYSVSLKGCTLGCNRCIRFAVNPVEV